MKDQRKSFNQLNKVYFFTATIHKWQLLLTEQAHKELIVSYLKTLSDKNLLYIYAFVLMPNPAYRQAGTFILYGRKEQIMAKKRHRVVF